MGKTARTVVDQENTQHKNNHKTRTMNAFKLNALLVALVALFAVASASRNLLQSTIPGTSIPTFPGFEAATQYFNPQAIQQFYRALTTCVDFHGLSQRRWTARVRARLENGETLKKFFFLGITRE